jgi:DNA-binding response OmpR family regulator
MIDEKNKTIHGVQLRPRQHKLVSYIITRPNELITRQEILDAVWGKDTLVKAAVIDVHLSQIRRLIPELKIFTRSGFGFTYVP